SAFSTILREAQCNIYDAEFSKIKYNQRLIGNILDFIESVSLRRCLTNCLHHPNCQSVNYMRPGKLCQILDDAFQLNVTGTVRFERADDWNHFETNYNRKTLGQRCTTNDLCPVDKVCKDSCLGEHQCVEFEGEPLYTYVKEASMSSDHGLYPAINAFDGIQYVYMNFAHTGSDNRPHWLKAVFKERLFIFWVEFFNRYEPNYAHITERSNNINLYTILNNNGQSIEAWFGNTETIGASKKFSCMKYADEIMARQPIDKSATDLNIGEIWMFGRVLKENF
uniref:Apple domain-containing protein n=2 Tax=Clytia hemisphaerica TaxID=252671 RepID=A0A7M5WR55_9CNID